MAAEELVVTHNEVKGVRKESRSGKDVVHAGGVIRHYHIALPAVLGHIVYICKVGVVLLGKDAVYNHASQKPVYKRRHRMQLAFLQLLLYGELIHMMHSLLLGFT